MPKIELELSEATIERLRGIAAERNESVSRVVEDEFASNGTLTQIPGLGLLADEPEIANAILQSMSEIRGQTDFRTHNG